MMERDSQHDYWVIFEQCDDGGYSVYVPDLPGCVSAGDDLDDARAMIGEAIELHIASMREQGEPIPAATTHAQRVHAA